MVILSLDAMSSKDMSLLKKMDNGSELLGQAACCLNIASVYPSLTYPAHTTIMTGKLPVHHGIINNTKLQPRRKNQDWLWQRKYIKGTTIYDEVIRDGKRVASLLWPVTAKSKIQYNLPEIFPNRFWQNQFMVSTINGSVFYQMELLKKFNSLRKGISQPFLDDFICSSAVHTLQKYKPDLTLVHFTDLDTHKHLYGTKSEQVTQAIKRLDDRVGKLYTAAKEVYANDDLYFVLLGDHSQIDTKYAVYPNFLLKEAGFITIHNNKVKNYKVYFKHCDGSGYLYENPRNRLTQEEKEKLSDLVKGWKRQGNLGIDRVFTLKSAKKMGFDKKCIYMIEAKRGYYLLEDYEVDLKPIEEVKDGKMLATHGYHPNKSDYKTFFAVVGEDMQIGEFECSKNLCDVGATIAKILGVELKDINGKPIEDIFQ